MFIPHSKPWIKQEDISAVSEVINSKNISQSHLVIEFENKICSTFNYSSCVLVDSGTRAIELGLQVLGVQKDDEVILPSYVCDSVLLSILKNKAIPVFCDIGSDWKMTVHEVESKITRKTKAIILVHIMGIYNDPSLFENLGIPIINDYCQCINFFDINLTRQRKSRHQLSVYSFHATKCISTGEGGALLLDNVEYIEKLKGIKENKLNTGSFTNIQASLGISQLNRYSDNLEMREKIADVYFQNLPQDLTKDFSNIRLDSIYYRFLLTYDFKPFDKIRSEFDKIGIQVRKGVDTLLHRQYSLDDKHFPNSIHYFNNTISVPIYPDLTKQEVLFITEAAKKILC